MKRTAISLCYDGALAEHLDVVRPLLTHHGFRATFFLSPSRVLENVQGWQDLAGEGHEMGNGSLLGVSDDGRLPNWTLRMVEQDLHMTQEFLANVFSESDAASFAYPGTDPVCAQGSYRGVVSDAFRYARSGLEGTNRAGCDTAYLLYDDVTAKSQTAFEQWRNNFEADIADRDSEPTWHVLRFGRMFDGENNRALLIHELVVSLLADAGEAVWVAPICEVASHLVAKDGLAFRL